MILNTPKKPIFLWLIAAICLNLWSCLSHSTLQTARTLPPGVGTTYTGLVSYEAPSINAQLNSNTPFSRSPIKDYTLVLGHRRGLLLDIDFGFQVALIGSTKVDVKYQLFERNDFYISTGLGLGYSYLRTGKGETRVQNQIIDYIVPLYTSYSLSPTVSLYFTPQQIIRDISGDTEGGMALFGYTIGILGGNDHRIALEFTKMEAGISSFALAYFFN